MTINDYCLTILESPRLEDKLTPPPKNLEDSLNNSVILPSKPNREKKIAFSDNKCKIPRLEHLNLASNRALALHHFANHELMALEIFAWAILKFQNISSKIRRDLFKTLREEQLHLQMYIDRIHELGMEFGDRPLNYIFWKFTPMMNSFEKFSTIMSISLEGANLDFATLYSKIFEIHGDTKSAFIMEKVFKDELAHVKRGLNAISIEAGKELDWISYINILPHPFTPRRAKGFFYFPDTRRRVGFSEDFINNLGKYRDEFSNRKKEIIPKELENWGIYSG